MTGRSINSALVRGQQRIGLCPKMKNHPLCGWIFILFVKGCLRYGLKGGGKVIKAHIVAMHLIVRAEIGKLVRNQRGTVYKIYIFIPARQRFKVGIADYVGAPFFPKPR